MQVTSKLKSQIVEAIRQDYSRKSGKATGMTFTRHANYLGISSSVYSRLMKGETEKLLSEGEWVRIGLELDVDLSGLGWKAGETETYEHISGQLEMCRENSLSAVFCDEKGIGKTYTAKTFSRLYPNVAYVDCSQSKTKREMIRAIARRFGFESQGRLVDVRQNMVDNILTLDRPLLILDEVGDLSYEAWLELKSIWNALEGMCGFYMMGANGLKKKIDKQIRNRTVGFEEIFDRYGDRYQQVTQTLTEAEKTVFKRTQCEIVLAANLPRLNKTEATRILNSSGLNLRRLKIEIVKYKTDAA